MESIKYKLNDLKSISTRSRLLAGLLVVFIVLGIVATVNIIRIQISYSRAASEYESIRQLAPSAVAMYEESVIPEASIPQPDNALISTDDEFIDEPVIETNQAKMLKEINPDYIGWISIVGTAIDYPVVQTTNNHKYLNTTFSGEQDRAGAIFMDYRNEFRFDGYLTILYGHNMRNGTMFAGLNHSLKGQYITITTVEGNIMEYRILEVRTTDVFDKAYTLIDQDMDAVINYLAGLGAPEGSSHLLMLSTCLRTGSGMFEVIFDTNTGMEVDADDYSDNTGRLLVFAVLV